MKTVNISLPDKLLEAADKQADNELRNRSELIREALRTYLIGKTPEAGDAFSEMERGRVQEILNFDGYTNRKLLVLSCVFRPQPNNIPDLFAGREAPVTKLLENPPSFRYAGWDLQTLDTATPVAGEFLQVANGERKVIRVYRDGQIILAGDEGFLGHGVNNEDEDPAYAFNGLAVSELIANFVDFSYRSSKYLENAPQKLIFKIQIFNPHKEPISLKNVIRNFPWPEKVAETHLTIADREIAVNPKELTFEKTAYKILGEFFYFFGMTEDKFWYVNKETKEVDLNSFRETRR